MNSEELIFQQYRLYTEQKDKFVDRSFHSNKFYLVLIVVLSLLTLITKGLMFPFGLTATLIFSFMGVAICILWWINMDSYNLLIKVKLSKVVEEIEKQLPVQPYTLEFETLKDLRKNKRMFLFSDMQKTFALILMLVFLVLFINEVVPIFVRGF